jgi:outer membrane protein insertion porin family
LRTSRPPRISSGDYEIETKGANIKFGVPFSEVDRVFFGIGVEQTQVETDATSPDLFRRYVEDFSPESGGIGTAKTTTFPLTAAWQRDSRDSALVPSRGRYQRARFELGLGNDTQYYIASYQHQYFKPFLSHSTLAGQRYAILHRELPAPVFQAILKPFNARPERPD